MTLPKEALNVPTALERSLIYSEVIFAACDGRPGFAGRAGALRAEPRSGSQAKPLIPDAGER